MKSLHQIFFNFARIVCAIAGLCIAFTSFAKDISLDTGWEYALGDSEFDSSGVPFWTQKDSSAQWVPIDFPADPPAQNDFENVWFRITLPDVSLRDPVFFASSIDLLAEAYLDGERIYKHGQFNQDGSGKFAGWPWHKIILPEDFSGKALYFRVFSDYHKIGFWGEVKLSERVDVLQQIVAESSQGLVVAGITLFIALMAAVFATFKGQRRQFLSVCFFSLAAAGLVLGDIPVMKLVWDKPLFWNYVGAYAYFLLPIPMFMLLAEWLSKANLEVRHFEWLWKFHLIFLVFAGMGSLSGVVGISQLYPIFDGIFIVTLLLLVGSVMFVFNQVRFEQKILILAYFGFCAVMLLDMFVAHGWVSWSSVPVSSGALLFSVAIIGLSFNHYFFTQRRLAKLNISLESEVNERTEQLTVMAEKERLRSVGLLFQQQKLEIAGDIVLALESCHTLEQGLDKIGNSIAELCQPFSGTFSIVNSDDWQDIQCWGRNIEMPTSGVTVIEHAIFDHEQGFFPFKIVNQQGLVRHVALLQVKVTEENSCYPVDQFMPLLQRAVEKISITLANIALREELQRFSYEDVLTNLKNRRFFTEVLEYEIASSERNKEPLSLLICDIDHFKKFNDTYGHPAGDEALKTLAGLLSRFFRQADIVCRLGGEEFIVIMPRAKGGDCLQRAEQLKHAVENTKIEYEGELLDSLTISIGIASWPELSVDPKQLFQQADLALYKAKESGRNCIRMSKLN
ncbi:MAG: diguanylate cyclase [Marinomonas foliarum]|uniref:GGDEF domain-containing protein n=1 Tax=Marinomonas foliarum TaxID=491950 RepID=UPI003F963062